MAPRDPVPRRADVVVVGGGIVGACAALFLARKGLSVALCEKGVVGGEQSGRNWGWCRMTLRAPAEIPLMRESLRLWRDPEALGHADTGYRTTGILYLCGREEGDADQYERWLDAARAWQLDSRMLGAAEVARLLPGSARSWPGALYTPSDGGAEPERAAAAVALAARREGASVLVGCAVRGIERSGGRVSAVVTEKGRIACNAVLVAAGVWSRLFCGNLGVDLPQLRILASVMRTAPLPGGPEISAAGPRFGFRRRDDGGYIVSQTDATIVDIVPDSFRLARHFLPALRGIERRLRFRLGRRFLDEWSEPRTWALDQVTPFERTRMLAPEPQHPVLDEAARSIAEALPAFRGMRIAGRWGGMIDVTPDARPVVSAVEQVPGLYLATGFSGHGFGIGPGAARLVADMIAGDPAIVDPAPYRFSRFAEPRASRAH